MEHGQLVVGGWVNVQFDDVCPGLKRGLHGGDGVFQIGVGRRVDALCRAGFVGQVLAVIGLVHAAMGDKFGLSRRRIKRQPGRVVKVDACGSEQEEERNLFKHEKSTGLK